MAYTPTDLDNIDTAIATGELEVEIHGPNGLRKVRYRSIGELKAAREHIASLLTRANSPRHPGAWRVGFSTSRE
jgi:hypothetical protein